MPRRSIKNARGAAAVEFAMVAPFFFLVVFGIIEFGRVNMALNSLNNASREAARLAIIQGATESEVRELAQAYAAQGSIADCTITIDPSNFAETNSETVSVSISVDYDDISWLPIPQFFGGRTLTSETTMRREGVAFTMSTDEVSSSSDSGSSDSASSDNGNVNGNGNGNGNGKAN